MSRYDVEIPGIDVVFDVEADSPEELDRITLDLEKKYMGKTAGQVVVGERQKLTPAQMEGTEPQPTTAPGPRGTSQYAGKPVGHEPKAKGPWFAPMDVPEVPDVMPSRREDRFTPAPPEPPPAPRTPGQQKVQAFLNQGLGPQGKPLYPGRPAGFEPETRGETIGDIDVDLGDVAPEEPIPTVPHAGSKFLASSAVDREKASDSMVNVPLLGKYFNQTTKPDGTVIGTPQAMKKRTVTLPDGTTRTIDVPLQEFKGVEPGDAPYQFLGESGPQDDRIVMDEKVTTEDQFTPLDVAGPAFARGATGIVKSVARMPELRDRILAEAGRKGAKVWSKFLGLTPQEAQEAEEAAPYFAKAATALVAPQTALDRNVADPTAAAAGRAGELISEHPALATLDQSRQGASTMEKLADPRALTGMLAENLPQIFASTGLGAAAPALALPSMMALEAGGQMDELDALRAQGKEIPEDRYLIATVGTGVLNGIQESLGGLASGGRLTKMFPDISGKVGAILATKVGKVGAGLLGESLTEGGQEWTNIFSTYFAEHPPQSIEEVGAILTDPKNWDRVAESAAVGGILGGGMSTVEAGRQAMQESAQRRFIEKNVPKAAPDTVPPVMGAAPLYRPQQAPEGQAPPVLSEWQQQPAEARQVVQALNQERVPQAPKGAVPPTAAEYAQRMQEPPPEPAPIAADPPPAEVQPEPTPQQEQRQGPQNIFRWIEQKHPEMGEAFETDPLTASHDENRYTDLVDEKSRLPNRRAFDAQAKQWAAGGTLGGMVVIDMDGLKRVNDTYGHDAGDEYIVTVADALRKIGYDVARVGGDEFAIVYDTSMDAAKLAADLEKVQSEMTGKQIELAKTAPGVQVTHGGFAYGIAAADGRSREETYRDADLAQKANKEARRGRPVGAGEISATPGTGAPGAAGEVQSAGLEGTPGQGAEGPAPEVEPPAPEPAKVYSADISDAEADLVQEAIGKSGADAPTLRGGILEGQSGDGWQAVLDALETKAGGLTGRARAAVGKLREKLIRAHEAGPTVARQVAEEKKAPEPEPEPERGGPVPQKAGHGTPASPNVPAIAETLAAGHKAGQKFRLRRGVIAEVEALVGGKIDASTPAIRAVDEAVELARVIRSKEVFQEAENAGESDEAILEKLNRLAEDFPASEARTSESKAGQEFSTPSPLAFVVSRLAGVTSDSNVLDNSAGNGAMFIGTPQNHAAAVELSESRAEHLRSQGIAVNEGDGRTTTPPPYPAGGETDVVLVNPPFGAAEQKGQKLEHELALEAVKHLKVGGTVGIIVGGPHPSTLGNEDARAVHYKTLTSQGLYAQLAAAGVKIERVFTVSGKIYERSGTTYPVDVLIGRKLDGPQETWPAFLNLPSVLKTEKELSDVLRDKTLGATWDRPGDIRRPRPGFGEKPVDKTVPPPPVSDDGRTGRTGQTDRGGSDNGTGAGDRGGRGGTDSGGVGRGPERQPREGDLAGNPPGVGRVDAEDGAGAGGDAGKGPAGSGPDVGHKQPDREGERGGAGAGGLGPADTGRPGPGVGKASDDLKRRLRERLQKGGAASLPSRQRGAVGLAASTQGMTPLLDALRDAAKMIQDEMGGVPFDSYLEILRDVGVDPRVAEFAVSAYVDAYDAASSEQQATMTDPDTGLDEWTDSRIREFLAEKPAAPEEKPAEKKSARKKAEVKAAEETTEEEGVELQVPNVPTSKMPSIGSLIPKSLAEATAKALKAVEDARGPIDEFVREELGFTKEFFYGKGNAPFSGEQIDALGLALHQFKQGRGFILADQTGIGKGRVVAGIMAWAIKNGNLPLFFTEKDKLYSDMMRDLKNIGFPQHEPLVTNNKLDLEIDPATKRKFINLDGAHADLLKEVVKNFVENGKAKGKTPSGNTLFDSIFTTYAQVTGPPGAKRYELLNQIAFGTVVVLDESHNAAGGNSSGMQQRGKKPSAAAPTHRGKRVAEIIGKAKAVLFSSATYAKRPDSLIIYASFTDAGRMKMSPQDLADTIADGGVPLQQALSHMLAESGQLIRREKSFKGIDFNVEVAAADKETSEAISKATRDLFEIDRIMDAHVKNINAESQGDVGRHGSVGQAQADRTQFSSLFNNLIGQALMALKVPIVVAKVKAIHDAGDSPFVTFSNTMEFLISENEAAAGVDADGDTEIDVTFADNLKRYLKKIITITTSSPIPDAPPTSHTLTDEELEEIDPALLEAVQAIREQLDTDETLLSIPGSPLDAIRYSLEEYGLKVAEATGRGKKVEYDSSDYRTGRIVSRSAEKQTQAQIDVIAGYNGRKAKVGERHIPKVDVIIANQSASTGISAHNSPETGENRRRRHMVIVSPESNIDTYMQMLGRINRTGQLTDPESLPTYTLFTSDLPLEIRQAAVLMRKMASLSANTTGSRTNVASFKMPDFVNQVGDGVMLGLLQEHPEINRKLGKPLKPPQDGQAPSSKGLAARATARVILLPINEAAEFYDMLKERYDAKIEDLDENGENPLVAKTIDLQAEEVASAEVDPKEEGFTGPFAEAVRLGVYKTRDEFKQFTDEELENHLRESLAPTEPEPPKLGETTQTPIRLPREVKLQTPEQHTNALVDAFDRDMEKRKTELEDNIRKGAKEGTDEAIINDRIAIVLAEAEMKAAAMRTLLRQRRVGDVLSVSMGGQLAHGVITKVEYKNKLANPWMVSNVRYTIALTDIKRSVQISAAALAGTNAKTQIMNLGGASHKTGEAAVAAAVKFMKDHHTGVTRRTRCIFTGNAMKAYARAKDANGHMVRFTMKDGTTVQGMLMPRNFDPNRYLDDAPVVLTDVNHVIEWLRRSGKPLSGLGDAVPLSDLRIKNDWGRHTLSCSKQGTTIDADVLAALRLATGDPKAGFVKATKGGRSNAALGNKDNVKTFLEALQASGLSVRYEITEMKSLAREIAGMPPVQTLQREASTVIGVKDIAEFAEVVAEFAKDGGHIDEYSATGSLIDPKVNEQPGPLDGLMFSLRSNTKTTGTNKAALVFLEPRGSATEILKAIPGATEVSSGWGGFKNVVVPIENMQAWMESYFETRTGAKYDPAAHGSTPTLRLEFELSASQRLRKLMHNQDTGGVLGLAAGAEARAKGKTRSGGQQGPISPTQPQSQRIGGPSNAPKLWASDDTLTDDERRTAPTRKKDILARIQLLAGNPIRAGLGRFKQRKALGWYMPRDSQFRMATDQKTRKGWTAVKGVSGALRVEDIMNMAVAAHEAGHSFHDRFLEWANLTAKNPAIPQNVAKELRDLGLECYGVAGLALTPARLAQEGFAELFSRNLFAMDTQAYPQATAWFFNKVLAPRPELEAIYHETARLIREYDAQGSFNRVLAHIETKPRTLGQWMQRGLKPLHELVDLAVDKMFSNVYKDWADDAHLLNKLLSEICAMSGFDRKSLTISDDPYRARQALEMAAPAMAQFAVETAVVGMDGTVRSKGLKPILEEIEKKYDLTEFVVYAVAKRAKLLHGRKIQSGLNDGDIHTVIANVEAQGPAKTKAYDDALDGVTAWSNAIMYQIVEAGGMSEEAYNLILTHNPVYLPFKRVFDAEIGNYRQGGNGSGGRGIVDRMIPVRAILGSSKAIRDPMNELIRGAEQMLEFRNQTLIARAALNFAEKVPWAAKLIQPVSKMELKATFPLEAIEGTLKEAGATKEMLDNLDLTTIAEIWKPATWNRDPKQNVFRLYVNGKPKLFEIDGSVADVFNGAVKSGSDKLLTMYHKGGWQRATARSIRFGATGLSIRFALRNPIRDLFGASVYTQWGPVKGRRMLKLLDMPGSMHAEGALRMARNAAGQDDQYVQMFRAFGANMATLQASNQAVLERYTRETFRFHQKTSDRVSDALLHLPTTISMGFDAASDLLGITEQMPRIAEFRKAYEAAKEQGLSEQNALLEATLASKDITTNFTRMGVIARTVNQYVPFFNARIQGADKFLRMFRNDPTMFSEHFQRLALMSALRLTAIGMVLWWLNKDDDDYQRMKDHEKNRFWCFKVNGRMMMFPKPDVLGAAFVTLPERILDSLWQGGDQETKNQIAKAVGNVFDSLSPVQLPENWGDPLAILKVNAEMLPAGSKVVLESGFMFSAFRKGQPLYPEWKKGKKERYEWIQPGTTQTAANIALAWKKMWDAVGAEGAVGTSTYQNLQIPPVVIDHAVSGFTGGLGLEAMRGLDWIGRQLKGEAAKMPPDASDLPAVGWAFQRPESSGPVDAVYEEAQSLSQKKGSRELSADEEDRLSELNDAIETFREAKETKPTTPEERRAMAKEKNEVAVHALGWRLRSEKAEERKNRFLRRD